MEPKDSKSSKSLRYSTFEGVFSSISTGFTQDFFTPFLLYLGGGVRHVGFLSALPNLFSSLIQLKSAEVTDRLGSRRDSAALFTVLQALMLGPMVLSFYLGSAGVAVFIAVVTLFTSFGAIAAPAYGSLLSDLVKENRRGEFFGWRNRIMGLTAVGASFAAGFILHQAEKKGILIGFTVIFAAALVFKLYSWRYIKGMHEPAIDPGDKDDSNFSIVEFLLRARESNFARFVIRVSAMKFAVNIASPFFAVLMLKDLGFSYLTYTVVTLAATFSTILCVRRWGAHSDRVGNLKVLRLTGRLIAFVPALWLVSQHPVYLVFIQFLSGFAWAGFNLSASNFIYDAASPAKRTRCIAYFNVLNGLSLFAGALLGGFLITRLPAGLFPYAVMNVILISSVLRFFVAYAIPFGLREVREVEKMSSHQLFISMLKYRPAFLKALR